MIHLISRFKAHFRHFIDKCVSLFRKSNKRPKKVTKVIELEAFGCVPASSADCVNLSKKYRTIS